MNWNKILTDLGTWLFNFVTTFGVKLIGALLVLIIGFKLVRAVVKQLRKGERFSKVDKGASSFVLSIITFLLKVVIVLTSCAIIGIPMTNFVTILASAGLAVGLALQGSLSNFAGGVMILIFRPFSVGDLIKAAGVCGTVKEITILYTMIDTGDNVRIVVPNGELSNAIVENVSYNETRRVDLKFGVSYKSDIKKVIALLTEMASSDQRVLKDKDIFTKISSYEDSEIIITLRVWVRSSDYWKVFFDLTAKAKEVFDQNGIEIPFPQMDVHVISNGK